MKNISQILSYHTNVKDAWDAMLRACSEAKESIHLEEYILDPDTIGTAFVDVFTRKAEEGVKVKLLLDWWGCKELKHSDQMARLNEAGVKVAFYREPSLNWITSSPRFFPRDHRKTLIIDEDTAFIGGVCLYDKVTHWRDTMVHVKGGLTRQIKHVFDQTWRKAIGDEASIATHPDFKTDTHYTVYANAPDSDENQFSDWLIENIQNAKKSIKLTSPYFTPGKRLMPALISAMERGVRCEIILSNYSKFAPYVVGKQQCGALIESGAIIYYFEPTMLHLKMMLIDDEKAAIGSCNLDGLSLHQNQEVMLVTDDEKAVSELNRHFEEDKSGSLRFSYADWQARPLHQKWAGYALKPFKRYL